ncbi:MAG: hypothetical protein N838_03830 [Thiohalocapsa sp. PB-PSB1]|jgi:phage-related baseplate assembly protein|nr:MAG: hypothetical protein N838_03830 [Thiohalocapsa sp. PB-PSB1]HCS90224.1 hypothetical protein [Chromatiaceae bacterium]
MINISQIPFPELAKGEPLEQIMADLEQRCRTAMTARLPAGTPPTDLGKPLIQALFKTMARREQQIQARINTAARAVMLATANGSDLDQVAALHGVKRLVIGPSDEVSSEMELEDDERLRGRARLAMDALSQSGTEGEYRFHALSASAQIKDVSVFASDQELGKVHVHVLSRNGRGDGTEKSDEGVLQAVQEALQSVQSITDNVEVDWAKIYPYHVKANLTLKPGAVPEQVRLEVLAALTQLIHDNHRLGKELLRDELFAAIYQAGVAEVILEEPATDRTLDLDTAPFNAADPEADAEADAEDKDITLLQISIVES